MWVPEAIKFSWPVVSGSVVENQRGVVRDEGLTVLDRIG